MTGGHTARGADIARDPVTNALGVENFGPASPAVVSLEEDL